MKAVQLIAFDASKNPYMPNEALQLLKSLHTNNLHVISVAGKYRTGKSYILNRVLLNQNQGFNVGHTINACTKGLWMWPQLISLNGKDCLIIDTEGLGSLQEGESTDLKIFLLALLFSSQLIYNSVGSIDEQAIESLSLVIQLATVLQRQDKYDSQELVNTFPAFMWLLRDFSLKLQNQKGVTISPVEYLQQALKHQARTSQAAQRKNQIRKQLRTFFQERDCFALVRPTEEERDLQNLSMVDDSKLRPEFVALVEGLKKRLAANVKPKRVRGRTLSTEGFIQLCQYYTKALVDGKLPTISSHWDNLCLAETHRIFQKFQLEHLKALESHEDNTVKMLTTHKSIVKQGMEAIEKSFLGKLEKQLFKQRFERRLQGQLQQIKSRVNSKKTLQVKLMLQNMQEQSSDEDPLMRFERVIMKMSQISENSNKDESHYCEFYLYLCQFSRNLLEEINNNKIEEQQISDNKILLLQEQITTLKNELQAERDSHDSQLIELRNKLSEHEYYSRKQQSDKQEKSLIQMFEIQSKVKQLTQQINDLSEKLQSKQIEADSLKKNQKQQSEKMRLIEAQLFQKEKQILEKDAQINLQIIKIRKMAREKQIIKQRYEQNLEEGLQMRTSIDALEKQLAELQDKKYSGGESDCKKIQAELRLCKEENKHLSRLLQEQRISYEAMLQVPQNISYHALKRNFELEHIEKCKLEEQINQMFGELPRSPELPTLMLHHSSKSNSQCSPNPSLVFDVSYFFNENQLIFEISMDDGASHWEIRRSWSNIKAFIRQMEQITIEQQSNELEQCHRNEKIRVLMESLFNDTIGC